MSEEEHLHSPKFLRRARIATFVLTAATAGGLLMNDWGTTSGKNNVFSGVQQHIRGFSQQIVDIWESRSK